MADKDKITETAKVPAPAKRATRKAATAKAAVAKPATAAKASAVKAPVSEVSAALAPAKGVKVAPKPKAPVEAPEAAIPAAVIKVAKPVAIKSAAPKAELEAAAAPGIESTPVSKAAPKTAEIEKPLFAGISFNLFSEDRTMDMSANFSGMQDAITEAQGKAKEAFEKSTAMLGEVSTFTKGNVEAMIESGKILAEGMQGMGSEIVSESRSAFETLTGDIKELAAAKSPTDFFKLQGDMMRKNFDSAVAYGSKSSESVLKLASDVIAPISGRVSLAMEKARTVSV